MECLREVTYSFFCPKSLGIIFYSKDNYYITKFEEIGDEIPIIKFKGKLQKQLVEMEEEQEILNVEDKINQIPNELLGNEKDYSNSIMSLEL